jgi:hypothetical protein
MTSRILALAVLAAALLIGAPQLQAEVAAAAGGVDAADAADLAAAPASTAEGSSTSASDGGQVFVGTWMLLNTPATNVVPPFYELITFHADGTLVQTENDLAGPPFPATTGHGVWRRSRASGLVLTYTNVHLVYDPTTFLPLGTLKILGRAVLGKDLNSLSGEVKATAFDLNGNVLFQATGTFAGTRIQNEPF